jgi:hypothetical protein
LNGPANALPSRYHGEADGVAEQLLAARIVGANDHDQEVAMTVPRKMPGPEADHQQPDPSEYEARNPEEIQLDPMLRLGAGRVRAWGITLLAVVIAVVLYVFFYGINSPNPTNRATVPVPMQAAKPHAGGSSGASTPGPPRANESGVKG